MFWLSGVVHPSVFDHPQLGLMLTPNMGNRPAMASHQVWWAADTGCFNQGETFNIVAPGVPWLEPWAGMAHLWTCWWTSCSA